MELTQEQRDQIQKNREKALERKRKREESTDSIKPQPPKEDPNVELEDFEIDASPYVSLKEAKSQYCLPDGTMQVCVVAMTKDNPSNAKFARMKLFWRTEIRQRARKRWDGLEGLQKERQRRAEARLEKDLIKTKDLFRK